MTVKAKPALDLGGERFHNAADANIWYDICIRVVAT